MRIDCSSSFKFFSRSVGFSICRIAATWYFRSWHLRSITCIWSFAISYCFFCWYHMRSINAYSCFTSLFLKSSACRYKKVTQYSWTRTARLDSPGSDKNCSKRTMIRKALLLLRVFFLVLPGKIHFLEASETVWWTKADTLQQKTGEKRDIAAPAAAAQWQKRDVDYSR